MPDARAPGLAAIAPANAAVASRFRRLAGLLELEGDNSFGVQAYRQAATAVADLSEDVLQIVSQNYGAALLHFTGSKNGSSTICCSRPTR